MAGSLSISTELVTVNNTCNLSIIHMIPRLDASNETQPYVNLKNILKYVATLKFYSMRQPNFTTPKVITRIIFYVLRLT